MVIELQISLDMCPPQIIDSDDIFAGLDKYLSGSCDGVMVSL